MTYFTKLLFTFSAAFLMSACGGGDGSGDSHTSTISVGPTSHVCKSEAAANMCWAGDCSQCQCMSGCPAALNEAITQSCLFYDGIARVPSTGCTLATTPVRTLVCSGAQLYALDGEGHTQEAVLQGVRFDAPQPYELFGFKFTCSS
jgi:hypothetical protein